MGSMGWKELFIHTSMHRQILAICVFSMSSFMIAFSMGFSSPAVPLIEKDSSISMNSDEASWIVFAVPGAALLTMLFMGPLVERFGRKSIMIVSSILLFFSWKGIENAKNVDDLIGYRFLCGIAVGAQVIVGSVYQSEIISHKLRAKFALFPSFLGTIGMLIVLMSGHLFDWRGIARFGSFLSIPLLIYFYLPESPYFLVATDRKTAAFNALTWLRRNEVEAAEEIGEQENQQKTKQVVKVGIAEAFQPPHRWSVCMAILLHIGQQATGITAITLYSTKIFEQLDSSLNASTCSIVIQLVNFCAVSLQIVLVPDMRRRRLVYYSSMLILASLLGLCIYVFLLNFGKLVGIFGSEPNILFGILPVLILSVYQIGVNVGWGPVPCLFLLEGLGSGSRGTGTSLAIAANWISSFIAAKIFLYLLESWGIFLVFWMFLMSTAFSYAIAHFFMPETENVRQKDINQIYEDSYIRTKIVVNNC